MCLSLAPRGQSHNRKAEEEAAKMKGEQDPEKYLMVGVRKVQLEVQQFEDEKEKKAHVCALFSTASKTRRRRHG